MCVSASGAAQKRAGAVCERKLAPRADDRSHGGERTHAASGYANAHVVEKYAQIAAAAVGAVVSPTPGVALCLSMQRQDDNYGGEAPPLFRTGRPQALARKNP